MHQRTTTKDALDLFLLDCQARRLTKSTQTFYRQKLHTFIAELSTDTLQDITSIHARAALAALAERGLSAQYQNNVARAARAFFNFCVAEKLIDEELFILDTSLIASALIVLNVGYIILGIKIPLRFLGLPIKILIYN